ncbi:MAG: SDR family NAD(P)-dependent oxidoreductase [Sandaracinaceae bacterium]|nr:SDR family NAD(P)-dependent oxidoreductase [Sandaracinaceae bacterium]
MRTFVLTGGTSGVGEATAAGLIDAGHRVVLVCRSLENGERVRRTLGPRVELVEGDLESQSSVRAAAAAILERYAHLDGIANIAGIAPAKRALSDDGIERTWATNFLGPYLLTTLLLDRLRRSAPARVVNVSGDTHRKAKLSLGDPELRHGWTPWRAATQAALAKVIWTFALARELEGTGVTANTFCPGFVRSRLGRELPFYARAALALASPFAQSQQQGATTPLMLLLSEELEGVSGRYFRKGQEREPNPIARDPEVQRELVALADGYVPPPQ